MARVPKKTLFRLQRESIVASTVLTVIPVSDLHQNLVCNSTCGGGLKQKALEVSLDPDVGLKMRQCSV